MRNGPWLPALALCVLPLAEPAGFRPVSTGEARILRSRQDASLATLRAGAVAAPETVSAGERAALRAAEARSPELAALRAGFLEISDQEFKVIAIVLAVVLILVLI